MIARRLPWLLALAIVACGEEAGTAGDCGTLDLKAAGGEIEVRFGVDHGDYWRVVISHEGHVAWRGHKDGPFTVTERVKDYRGPDLITARASGPHGEVCTRTGTVAD